MCTPVILADRSPRTTRDTPTSTRHVIIARAELLDRYTLRAGELRDPRQSWVRWKARWAFVSAIPGTTRWAGSWARAAVIGAAAASVQAGLPDCAGRLFESGCERGPCLGAEAERSAVTVGGVPHQDQALARGRLHALAAVAI